MKIVEVANSGDESLCFIYTQLPKLRCYLDANVESRDCFGISDNGGLIFYTRIDKIQKIILCDSAVFLQTRAFYFVPFYLPPEANLVAHGNMVLFFMQRFKIQP